MALVRVLSNCLLIGLLTVVFVIKLAIFEKNSKL